jgi:hypothetical protein
MLVPQLIGVAPVCESNSNRKPSVPCQVGAPAHNDGNLGHLLYANRKFDVGNVETHIWSVPTDDREAVYLCVSSQVSRQRWYG